MGELSCARATRPKSHKGFWGRSFKKESMEMPLSFLILPFFLATWGWKSWALDIRDVGGEGRRLRPVADRPRTPPTMATAHPLLARACQTKILVSGVEWEKIGGEKK